MLFYFTGNTALYVASQNGLLDIVKCLVDSGADIDYPNSDGI